MHAHYAFPMASHDLIVISDSELGAAHNDVSGKSDPEILHEVRRLHQQSTQKFKDKWDEILSKYARIDDERESDEIDLATGEIVTDNGHLRSLSFAESNIWDDHYDDEAERTRRLRRESLARRNKHQLRDKLKLLLAFSSPVRSRANSPFASSTAVPPGNLVEYSPKKKKRSATPTEPNSTDNSPSKIGFDKLLLGSRESSPLKRRVVVNSDESDASDFSETEHPGSFRLSSPTPRYRWPVPNLSPSLRKSFPEVDHLKVELIYSTDRRPPLFRCVLCPHTDTIEYEFRLHLLAKHMPQLYDVGYPVSGPGMRISPTAKQRLVHFFPLIPTPPPYTKVLIQCPKLGCTRSFPTHRHLERHSCSAKRQLYMCPLLGCEFASEDYHPWRDHICGHENQPNEIDLTNSPTQVLGLRYKLDTDGTPDTLSSATSLTKEDIESEINALFSD